MIRPEQIAAFFPAPIRDNPLHRKYIIKEYLQLMILDYLSATPYVKKIAFIGGTCLRLIKGIDRFSEDLDFDCKDVTEQDFTAMTDGILSFLQRAGWRAEVREKASGKLKAFRKNIYFPELLFDLGLSGYREERFLVKIEAQDQGVAYAPVMANIKGCGFFFPFPVPPDDVLCAMKIAALLSRRKGRDFYDAMFLLALTRPNYAYLTQRCSLHTWEEVKGALLEAADSVDLKQKSHDFERLLFQPNSAKILLFRDFIVNSE